MSILGYIKITRPVNTVVAGITAILAYLITGGTNHEIALLLFLAVTFICGAGNSINDCFDADIDRINRPDRPIPRGNVSIIGGVILTVVLFIVGFACSLPILPWCPWLAAVNILLLVLYSSSFKRMPIIGNICVAYLSGSIFLFGGMAVGPSSFMLTGPLFLVTFFGTLAREMLKDAEDIAGDKEAGAYTLPMIVGVRSTATISFVSMCLASLASLIPIFKWGVIYAVAIICVDIFLLWTVKRTFSCKTSEDIIKTKATTKIKIGMFIAIFVFIASVLLTKYFGILTQAF